MKYKVGDKVRIKSIDWYNENKDEFGCVGTCRNCGFTEDMVEWCGEVMTIDDALNETYKMKEDGGASVWDNDMIEGLEPQEGIVGMDAHPLDLPVEHFDFNNPDSNLNSEHNYGTKRKD